MISVFVYPLLRCWDSWAERSLAAAHVADSNAIAARLQGPFLGVSLDALSLEAAEATRRDACEKSGFESSLRPDAGTRGLLSLAVTRARPTAQ